MGAENSRTRCLDGPRRLRWIGKFGRGAHCAELGGKVGVLDMLKSCPSIKLQVKHPADYLGSVSNIALRFSQAKSTFLKVVEFA